MARHVFASHDQVAHVWANDRQEVGHGRTGGGRLFFENDTIYSYGSHFPIARFVTVQGREVVLFTTRSYSMSTAKHKGLVRRALGYDRTNIIEVRDPSSSDWRGMADELIKDAVELRGKAARRRLDYMRSYDLDAAAAKMTAARQLATLGAFKLPADDDKAIAAIAKEQARAEKAAAAARAEREAEARNRLAAVEALWEQAKPYWRARQDFPAELYEAAKELGYSRGFFSFTSLSIAMRLTADGAEIETSWNARFPVDHGVRAFRIMKGIWARGENWTRRSTGPRLGHFTVDTVSEAGVRAGCHFVPRSEVELMAETLAVADVPAAEMADA